MTMMWPDPRYNQMKILRSGVVLVGSIFLAVAPARSADTTGALGLVWSDEFTGNSLDLSKWEFVVDARGGGNKELQYYVTNNVRVRDGFLTIEARKEHYTGTEGTREYTSSRIRTKAKGDWLQGRFEVRARLPQGKGMWPAIWMLPTENRYGAWPLSGEIDIMELLGHQPKRIHATLHYADLSGHRTSSGKDFVLSAGSFADGFHVFRLDWGPTGMRWYVDGKSIHAATEWYSGSNRFPAPFDQKFHLILNVAVGGRWPGDPDSTTQFPQAMLVDYVRVYQRK